jgi:hypothetical protein
VHDQRDDEVNRQTYTNTTGAGAQGPEVAEGFLQQLRPNGPWVLIGIDPNKEHNNIFAFTAHNTDEVSAFVKEYNGTRNLYYSVNPTKTAMNKKPSKADIAAIEYLLGDLDPRDDETSEDAKARYLEQFENGFEPPPSALVDSGNGIQALWQLDEPIGVEGADRDTHCRR